MAWLGFAASMVGLFSYLLFADPGPNAPPTFLLVMSLATVMALTLMSESRRTRASGAV